MDTSYEIVNTLSPEDRKLLRKHISNYTFTGKKGLQLLDLLCFKEKMTQDQMIIKIYGNGKEKDKAVINAYHQLGLRLNEKIEDFILQQIQKEGTTVYMMKFVSIAGYLLDRANYKWGWHYLKKAEELGIKIEQYELLNQVYCLQLKYAWRIAHPPEVEQLIKKRENNLLMIKKGGDINVAYALIRQRLGEAKVAGENLDIEGIIESILEEFNIEKETKEQPSLIYGLLKIVGISLYEKKAFKALEKYTIEMYEKMEKANMFDRHNHNYKINLLTSISGLVLQNRKYDLCEKYIDILNRERFEYISNATPSIQGIFIESELYRCTGRPLKARQLLEETQVMNNILDAAYLCFNLIAHYMIEENYSKAIQCFLSLQKNEEVWIKEYGIEGDFIKHMSECIIHLEIGSYEYVNYKLRSVERKFKEFLADPANHRYKIFLMLFKRINKDLDVLLNADFIKEVDHFIAMKPIEPGDSEFISFNAWLKAKVKKRKYYDVFMEMVNPGYQR